MKKWGRTFGNRKLEYLHQGFALCPMHNVVLVALAMKQSFATQFETVSLCGLSCSASRFNHKQDILLTLRELTKVYMQCWI